MDYRKFKYDNENYLIFRTIEKYSRTTSGKSWKSKPDEVEMFSSIADIPSQLHAAAIETVNFELEV